MKKRLLVILAAAVMLFAFTSCKEADNNPGGVSASAIVKYDGTNMNDLSQKQINEILIIEQEWQQIAKEPSYFNINSSADGSYVHMVLNTPVTATNVQFKTLEATVSTTETMVQTELDITCMLAGKYHTLYEKAKVAVN